MDKNDFSANDEAHMFRLALSEYGSMPPPPFNPETDSEELIKTMFDSFQFTYESNEVDPSPIHLYQSQESLVSTGSTMSNLTGMSNISQSAERFRESYTVASQPPAALGADGKLDMLTFSRLYPKLAEALEYIITYTYNNLLCTLTSFPTASLVQIKVVDCYRNFIEEHDRMYPFISIEQVSPVVLDALMHHIINEIITLIDNTRESCSGHLDMFGLSSANSPEVNRRAVATATHLSFYLHGPRLAPLRRSLLPYMNPVLTQSIRSAFYFSHKSIVKRVHLLLKRYPALEHAEYCRNWSDGIPRGAWVLCCVALRQAIKQYETGTWVACRWTRSSRNRFKNIDHALREGLPPGYYEAAMTYHSKAWYRDLHLDEFRHETQRGLEALPPPLEQGSPGSDQLSVYEV